MEASDAALERDSATFFSRLWRDEFTIGEQHTSDGLRFRKVFVRDPRPKRPAESRRVKMAKSEGVQTLEALKVWGRWDARERERVDIWRLGSAAGRRE